MIPPVSQKMMKELGGRVHDLRPVTRSNLGNGYFNFFTSTNPFVQKNGSTLNVYGMDLLYGTVTKVSTVHYDSLRYNYVRRKFLGFQPSLYGTVPSVPQAVPHNLYNLDEITKILILAFGYL